MTYRQFIKTAAGFLVVGFCCAATAAADPIGVAQANATMNQGTDSAAAPAALSGSPLTMLGLFFAPTGRGAVASEARCFSCIMGTTLGAASANDSLFGAILSGGGLTPIIALPIAAPGAGSASPVVLLLPPALFTMPTPFLILVGSSSLFAQSAIPAEPLIPLAGGVQAAATPEPAMLTLFAGGLGLAAFGLRRRRTTSMAAARRFGGQAAALAAVVLAAGWLYWPVGRKLVGDWLSDPDYSHGLVCAPLALAIAWSRRRSLAAAPFAPRAWAGVAAAAALGLLVAGRLGAELFVTRVSLLLFIAASIVFLFGPRHLRLLAFPFALLFLSIPIPAIVAARITLPLQFVASSAAETIVRTAGVPVLREGNVLLLPNAALQVAEACSGIRSLVALVTIALIFARYAESRAAARVAITLSAVPVAVLINALRVTATAFATYAYGPAAAEGAVHEAMGWIMFVIALALVALCAAAIARLGTAPVHQERVA